MEQQITVKCPTCGQAVVWNQDSEFRPFCSKRCRLIDLGAWADNQYTIEQTQTDIWSEDDSK